jgi:ketosteroid isomerase-like protein
MRTPEVAMNRFALAAWLLTAWLCLSAAPTSLLAAPAASRDADAVKALDLKRFELAVAGDVDALAKLLADDLTYTHSSGALDDKSKFLDSLRSGKLKYTSLEPSDVQVRAYGTTAVVIGQVKVGSSPEVGEADCQFAWATEGWGRPRARNRWVPDTERTGLTVMKRSLRRRYW